MLNRFLPRQADNTYQGATIALWFFGVLVVMRLIISLNSLFNTRAIASSADGIPLHTFTPAAESTVVSLFALLGLSNLIMGLMCVVVLARYRSLVPLMFALLLFHHLARKVVHYFLPVIRTTAATASVVNGILLTLMVAGLALSLWSFQKRRPVPPTTLL